MTNDRNPAAGDAGGTAPQPRPPEPGIPTPRISQKDGEIGGPSGPEPTRYGDWERNGRCTDF